MKTKKPIYRFFSAFLIVAVLLAMLAPASAQSREVIEKVCNMLSGEQATSTSMQHSCKSQKAVKTIIQNVDKSGEASCHTGTAYLCCLSESPVGPKATPVSQTVSNKIVALQIATISQPAAPSPPVSSFEQQFIEATTSSPPLFLKNSAFLN